MSSAWLNVQTIPTFLKYYTQQNNIATKNFECSHVRKDTLQIFCDKNKSCNFLMLSMIL